MPGAPCGSEPRLAPRCRGYVGCNEVAKFLCDVLASKLCLLLLLRFYCAGQRSTPHYRTLEVRPGRIKLELKYDYERDDTNSLLGVLMFGWDVVIANNE